MGISDPAAGCIDVLTFDEIGVIQGRIQLDTRTPIIQIAVATRHTCFVRTPDTVVIEIKPGPYRPNEFCDWAPDEGARRTKLLRMACARGARPEVEIHLNVRRKNVGQ
jgi:hypothetical protein